MRIVWNAESRRHFCILMRAKKELFAIISSIKLLTCFKAFYNLFRNY